MRGMQYRSLYANCIPSFFLSLSLSFFQFGIQIAVGAAELPVAGLSRRTALFPLYPSGLYAKGLLPDRENANMFSACKSGKSSALPVRPFTSASESASSSASSSSDRASDSGGGKCETLRLSYRDLMTTSEKCKGDTNSNAQCRGIKDRAKRKQEALKVCREANNQADSDDSDAAAVTSGSTSNSASSSSDSAASIGREGGREGELGHSGSDTLCEVRLFSVSSVSLPCLFSVSSMSLRCLFTVCSAQSFLVKGIS